MRYQIAGLGIFLSALTPAFAQTYINFSTPGVRISIDVPLYPSLQRVPGYPVYYAPSLRSNYFFYDGMYWVYEEDNWYASSWYNGPWWEVNPLEVPYYVLRVPVRYYRHAPAYFRSWSMDQSPRWGDHWGNAWQQRRSGWNQWNRSAAPPPAPLPTYQRQYSGRQYPQAARQAQIQTNNYRYQPNDVVAQQRFQHLRSEAQSAPPQAPNRRDPAAARPQPGQSPGNRGDQQSRPTAPDREQQPGRQQAQPPQSQRPVPAPAAREQPVSPPQRGDRSDRNERQAQQPQAAREQPPGRQQPEQAGRGQQPPAVQPPQAPKPPPQSRDRSDKDRGDDKGNDGERGNDKERKGRDR